MLEISIHNIRQLMKDAKSYRKMGLSYAFVATKEDVANGIVSPCERQNSRPMSGHIRCLGDEGYKPLNLGDYVFMSDPSKGTDLVEYWTNDPEFVKANKEKTDQTIEFDGRICAQYRNTTIVKAIFITGGFKLTDQKGRVFDITEDYWIILNENGGVTSWYPCATDKFVYELV